MEEDFDVPIILGRPFLATGRALIDVQQGKLVLRVQDDQVTFDVFKAMKYAAEPNDCLRVDAVDKLVESTFSETKIEDPLEACLVRPSKGEDEAEEVKQYMKFLEANPPLSRVRPPKFEELGSKKRKSSIEEQPILELKHLPSHLKYAFLNGVSSLPVIISSSLTGVMEEKLLRVLREHKKAIGWTIADIKGISPSICMHKILMEDQFKSVIQPQRRLNPKMQEVVKAEVIKLLDTGIIYPISDSAWVSPVQVVPKKGGMTVLSNDDNELIPTRTVTGWRVCMDYRKLNDATRKDHFPLPFIDQMLERLTWHEFYHFLDGYFGYKQLRAGDFPLGGGVGEGGMSRRPPRDCCMMAPYNL